MQWNDQKIIGKRKDKFVLLWWPHFHRVGSWWWTVFKLVHHNEPLLGWFIARMSNNCDFQLEERDIYRNYSYSSAARSISCTNFLPSLGEQQERNFLSFCDVEIPNFGFHVISSFFVTLLSHWQASKHMFVKIYSSDVNYSTALTWVYFEIFDILHFSEFEVFWRFRILI